MKSVIFSIAAVFLATQAAHANETKQITSADIMREGAHSLCSELTDTTIKTIKAYAKSTPITEILDPIHKSSFSSQKKELFIDVVRDLYEIDHGQMTTDREIHAYAVDAGNEFYLQCYDKTSKHDLT